MYVNESFLTAHRPLLHRLILLFGKIAVLTPVNEYNISDKIQSANNLLFASSITEQETLQIPTMSTNKLKLQSNHRVTFSSDIEEYDDNETVIAVEEMDHSWHENEEEIEEIVGTFEDELRQSPENEIDAHGDDDDSSDNDTIIARQNLENIDQSSHEEQIDLRCEEISCEIYEPSEETNSADMKISLKPSKSPSTSRFKSDTKIRSQKHKLLDIHLNVRKCCEFKYLENDRLPRYNGYISQYGLSKDQLDHIEKKKRFNQQQINEMRTQCREVIARKSAENERAFAKWLFHKQKTTISRTKNMYDSK